MFVSPLVRHTLVIILLYGLLLLGLPGRLAAQETPAQKPLMPEWRLVAAASHIFRGKLVIDPKTWLHVPIFRIEKATALKGRLLKSGADAVFSLFMADAPQLESIQALVGTEVIVLARRFTSYASQDRYYLFTDDPTTILPATAARHAQIRSELSNQEKIVAAFARSPLARPDRYHNPVKQQISRLFEYETEQEAVDALLKMGKQAVPSLIRLMDDRRPVAGRLIGFPNPPRAPGAPPTGTPADFESHYYMAGDLVVDDVDLVLSFLTREPLGSLDRRSTEEERKAAVRAWRVYLHYSYADTFTDSIKTKN